MRELRGGLAQLLGLPVRAAAMPTGLATPDPHIDGGVLVIGEPCTEKTDVLRAACAQMDTASDAYTETTHRDGYGRPWRTAFTIEGLTAGQQGAGDVR